MKIIPVRHINSGQTASLFSGRFTIRDLQAVLDGRNLVHDLHRHNFFFVLALRNGGGMHEIDFVPYNVHDHTIFILRPGQVHRLELTGDSAGFLMEFDQAFYQPKHTLTDQRWKKASGKNYCAVESARFVKLYTILSCVLNEFTSKQEGYEAAIKANLDLFFIEYLRQSRQRQNTTKAQNRYTQDRFEEFVDLLEQKIGTMKNVTQYAEQLSLSAYQLNAITKASVAKTVSDLINEQIILEAKRYLLATTYQVKDIADHLGYEDVSYFIRFFKKHTGHTPELFRKNFT